MSGWMNLTVNQQNVIEEHGHSCIVVGNAHFDPLYTPYCMRCERAVRMHKVEPFHWTHHCGAVCDARAAATAAGLLP